MEDVKIRNFIPADMEKILDYREESGSISFPGLAMNKEKEREHIKEHVSKYPGTIKVAEIGGRIAGYIRFHVRESSFGDYAIIDTIFVEKNCRKTGIGKLLHDAAEKHLLFLGVKDIEATVTDTNIPSLSFFKSRGYEEKRTVLEKRINAAPAP